MTIRPLHRLAFVFALLSGLLAACSVVDQTAPIHVDKTAAWAVLPFTNATETPLAAQRAEAMSAALLRSLGVGNVSVYPPELAADGLFDPAGGKDRAAALEWARKRGARYALAGTVEEWRYKVGVDGEPAAGISLSIIDLNDERTVWSGVGARSGWSRDSLAAVGQKLIRSLLEPALR